jgi:hypothetical protein
MRGFGVAEMLGWTDEALDELARLRGWTEDAVDLLALGWDDQRGVVEIPIRDALLDRLGTLTYLPDPASRNGRRKMTQPAGVPRQLFPPPESLALERGQVILGEGEPDAVAATAAGFAAVGVPGTQGWKAEHAARFRPHWTVCVVGDCDAEGRGFARRAAADLVGVGVDARVVELDANRHDGYDLTEYLLEHGAGELCTLLDEAELYTPPASAPAGTGSAARGRITRIADVTPRRVEWLEEGLIACDMLTGLVAPGGIVKGLYGIHEAAKLATRGERTLFVCSEDALDYIVRPRFQAAGCDGDLAYALSIDTDVGERVPRFPSDLPLLEAAIAEVRPRLVIVDPVASYIDPGLDMGKNNEMRLILQPLIALARSSHVAILVVYHLGKHRERGAIGTVAFEDACRQVLTAARDDDDEDVRHVELTKSNIGPTGYGRRLRIVGVPLEIDGEVVEVAKLVDEGPSWKSVHALLARKAPPGPEPEKRELARDVLVEALVAGGTGGINADEAKRVVAEKAGVSTKTVWRAFTELKAEELVTGQPTRDEFGAILEWRWVAKLALLVGRNDA